VQLPDFIFERRGSAGIYIDRHFAEQKFVDLLEDVDRLFKEPGCEIIKDQKKIKVGRLGLRICGEERCIYIKRYNAFSLRYRICSLLSRSGAFRSLYGAAILRNSNIQTARPVAAVENRVAGVLTKSFLLTEAIARAKTADAFWVEDLLSCAGPAGVRRRRAFLTQLAQLFRALHGMQIYHNDLKDANIMVTPSTNDWVTFYLVDLEGVRRFTNLSQRRRIKNLLQLHRTLGTHLRSTEKLRFLKTYLGPKVRDKSEKLKLISGVLRAAK
jgi:hypothetical protein